MNELKRLYSLKTVLIIAAMVIINMGLFILSCAPGKKITMTGRELKGYISEYPEFLKNARSNGGSMSVLSMYKSGFAADNIRKTAEAYAKLGSIKPEYGDNRGAVTLFQYTLTDILLLAFLMIMSLQFFSERKKGLVNLVRSTARGRGVLYIQRITILALSALGMGILLYGGNFIGMCVKLGSGGMSRAVQSLPEFKQCPYSFSIGGYFLISCLLKISACFMSALAFFLIISLLGTAAAYTLTAAAAVAEVLLFTLIPPVSSLNALKFINILAIIKCGDFLSVCRNLNIFGKAVPAFRCNAVFLIFMIVFLFAAGYIIHGKMHVRNKKFLEGIINKLGRIAEKISFQRTLFGWECFKLLVKQGGLFFIAAAFFLTVSSSMKYDSVYPVNIYEKGYYEQYEGVITRKTFVSARNEYRRLEDTIEHYQKAIDELLAKGEKFLSNIQEQKRLDRLRSAQNEAITKRDALLPVLKTIHSGYVYTKEHGRTVNLIKPYTYDMLINRDKQSCRRASLYILIGIIGAVSGVFAYDRQNNMKNTLQSSYRGRGRLVTVKAGAVFIVCVMLCVSLHLVQIVQVGKLMGYNNIDVPVQSLTFMRGFEPYVSIRGYIVMLFAVRTLAAFGVGVACAAVSRFCVDTVSAMGISVFLFAVPAVFSEILPGADKLSCVYLISGEYFR